jgi:hypothetical protein
MRCEFLQKISARVQLLLRQEFERIAARSARKCRARERYDVLTGLAPESVQEVKRNEQGEAMMG